MTEQATTTTMTTPTQTAQTSAQTSRQWWAAVRRDPARLNAWLLDQFRGEATAATRIRLLRDHFANDRAHAAAARVLTIIADQEAQHASWVADLLRARSIEPVVLEKPARYWEACHLEEIADLEAGCAVGAWAERMRLERIEVIAADDGADDGADEGADEGDDVADIRDVFRRILPEERFHERAFSALAGTTALHAAKDAHELGRRALGLHP